MKEENKGGGRLWGREEEEEEKKKCPFYLLECVDGLFAFADMQSIDYGDNSFRSHSELYLSLHSKSYNSNH